MTTRWPTHTGVPVASPPPLTIASIRTLGSVLTNLADEAPAKPLLVFESATGAVTTYTRSEMLERATALALLLQGLGVRGGSRVHLHLSNRPEFLQAWFAAALLGASIVPTNVVASSHELEYILDHSGADVTITERAGFDTVTAARRCAAIGGVVLVCEAEQLMDLPRAGTAVTPIVTDPLSELAVMYTSGTTARPKGVVITHANYIYAGEVVAASASLTDEDRYLTVLPLFHANAQYYSTMATLVTGGTLVLIERFSATRFVDQARRHHATVGSLFAAPIRMILAKRPAPHWRDHTLRLVLFAQNLHQSEIDTWECRIGAPLLQLYGMTETIGPPLINPLHGLRRHSAVGRPSLGYACQIVREDGTQASVGEPGELLVHGVPGISLMAGYLHDPAATAYAIRDGWLHTGDIVRLDEDGLVSFVDRRKDMIKRSGENIAASEVEAVLLAHPSVADAAVVGVPDAVRDEDIVAFVVPLGPWPTEMELTVWCEARLSQFRVPSAITMRKNLPRTSVGKIQKHILREEWLQSRPAGGR